MIVKTLVEDTSLSPKYKNEHGFSLYIETKRHKILFDLGASDLFLENAKKMDVNIEAIDLVIISHGHYDHGGGLNAFLGKNTVAKIYVHENAFDKHYSISKNNNPADIGLDESLKQNNRIIYVSDFLQIDEELSLFSHVTGREFFSSCNKTLFAKSENHMVQDNFDHEQNLIISENEKTVLIAGCAHNGIINILKHFAEIKGYSADLVLGGFHLFNNSAKISESPTIVNQIGEVLNKTNSKYYTGHCTGLEAFRLLKEIMKDNIQYLSTGTVVEI